MFTPILLTVHLPGEGESRQRDSGRESQVRAHPCQRQGQGGGGAEGNWRDV